VVKFVWLRVSNKVHKQLYRSQQKALACFLDKLLANEIFSNIRARIFLDCKLLPILLFTSWILDLVITCNISNTSSVFIAICSLASKGSTPKIQQM